MSRIAARRWSSCPFNLVEVIGNMEVHSADVLHQRYREIHRWAGEIDLELEHCGGDLKDETAKTPTEDVYGLLGDVVLGLTPLGEPYRSYS